LTSACGIGGDGKVASRERSRDHELPLKMALECGDALRQAWPQLTFCDVERRTPARGRHRVGIDLDRVDSEAGLEEAEPSGVELRAVQTVFRDEAAGRSASHVMAYGLDDTADVYAPVVSPLQR
jgi:hypothetical protein